MPTATLCYIGCTRYVGYADDIALYRESSSPRPPPHPSPPVSFHPCPLPLQVAPLPIYYTGSDACYARRARYRSHLFPYSCYTTVTRRLRAGYRSHLFPEFLRIPQLEDFFHDYFGDAKELSSSQTNVRGVYLKADYTVMGGSVDTTCDTAFFHP